MSDDSKYFVRAFLRFLQKEIDEHKHSADSVESLEVAAQCLQNVYDLVPSSSSSAAVANDADSPLNHVDLFDLFRSTFCQVSEERKLEADNVKNEGNLLMKEEKYVEALNAYNKAINLDATNPVFYCNRAAAFSRLGDYERAAEDCRTSLRYDPTYSKAYGRLGIAYSKLNKHELAWNAYKEALALDPDNQDYQNNFEVTQKRLEEIMTGASSSGQPGGPGVGGGVPNPTNAFLSNFANRANSIPGMPNLDFSNIDFQAALNNPALLQTVSQMLTEPSVQQLISQCVGGSGAGFNDMYQELINMSNRNQQQPGANGQQPPPPNPPDNNEKPPTL